MRHARPLLVACLLALAVALPAGAAQAATPAQIMIGQFNAFRAAHGLPRLRESRSLDRSAGRYSGWLMSHGYFGHLSSIRASRRFDRLGEIIELHRGGRAQITRTVHEWERSPGHRAILLSHSFRYVGVGHTSGRFHGHRSTIWVGHFGAL